MALTRGRAESVQEKEDQTVATNFDRIFGPSYSALNVEADIPPKLLLSHRGWWNPLVF